ncbi:MAG: VWA domain-containing protein [Acidobacteriota bacterium]
MRFAQPAMLLWWTVLPVAGLIMGWALARQRSVLGRIGHHETVRRMAQSASLEHRIIKAVLLLTGGFFLVLALARPQWGRIVQPVTRRGVDVVLVLDLSTSMLAEDVAPSRIRRAKVFASDLIQKLEGNRIGLVAFAGSAFVQCPVTLDQAAAQLFLDLVEVGDIADGGSDLGQALKVSLDAFPERSPGQRVIVLLSDGEEQEETALDAVREARSQGAVVYTVGVGTPGGGPIPLGRKAGKVQGYKKDEKGRVVTTRLRPDFLATLAEEGGGRFYMANASLSAVGRLADRIDAMEKADLSSRIVTSHRERFQIPLALCLVLLILEAGLSGTRRRAEDS